MNESNIGQTIKSVVSILCVIGIIACVIAGIALISQGLGAIGWPIMLVGAFSMAITYLFLYGFGELVDKTCENNAAMLRIERELRLFREEESLRSKADKAPAQTGTCTASSNSNSAANTVIEDTLGMGDASPKSGNAADAVLMDTSGENVIPVIKTMKSAQQIYSYLSERLDTSDENIRELLKILNYRVSAEKDYELGNKAQEALAAVVTFVKQGSQLFAVDRNKPTFICPACGKELRSYRTACNFCGALFRQ